MENMYRRRVDTKEYVDVLRGLTEEGKEVSMLVAGSSMNPFLIHYRDTIFFSKPQRPLRRGDMVFYQRESGQYVMHRILRVKPEGLYIVGDAQTEIEGPVRPEQVFAVITRVKRKGKMIGPDDFWWKFFEGPWLCLLPLRHIIMRLYALKHRKAK